jgi:hypothetical protein
MEITNSKVRPIKRGDGALRDDRLFLIACDDTYAPVQYFSFFRISRVQVHIVPTLDGSTAANRVLDRLLELEFAEGDERWMILDTDHVTEGTHLGTMTSALARARANGVQIAMSCPSFELWLLLHHEDVDPAAEFNLAGDVIRRIREVVGNYSKKQLRLEHYPLASVVAACRRARNLDQLIPPDDIPKGTASRLYKIWEAIVAKSLVSQLPAELAELLPAAKN